MAPIAWDRITFTAHMVEAAAVVAECHVAFDFEGHEQTTYEVKVYRALKGASGQPFFAVATKRDDPAAFRPTGEGESAEAALEACLQDAGIYHRRRVRQTTG
jgi:hypothetical protein